MRSFMSDSALACNWRGFVGFAPCQFRPLVVMIERTNSNYYYQTRRTTHDSSTRTPLEQKILAFFACTAPYKCCGSSALFREVRSENRADPLCGSVPSTVAAAPSFALLSAPPQSPGLSACVKPSDSISRGLGRPLQAAKVGVFRDSAPQRLLRRRQPPRRGERSGGAGHHRC
jgi:hypothetical protein